MEPEHLGVTGRRTGAKPDKAVGPEQMEAAWLLGRPKSEGRQAQSRAPTLTPCPSTPRPACWCESRGRGQGALEEAARPADGQHRWERSGHVHRPAVRNLMSFPAPEDTWVVVPGCCGPRVALSHPARGLVKELGKQEELRTQTP